MHAIFAKLPGLLEPLKRVPEWQKYLLSLAATIACAGAAISLIWLVYQSLKRCRNAYWRLPTGLRKAIKACMYVSITVSFVAIGAGLVVAMVWPIAQKIAGPQLAALDLKNLGWYQVVYKSTLSIGLGLAFFLSWCKSSRAELLERALERGELSRALLELEELRQEPGQNITVDAHVACLHAYALILAGRGEQAVACLMASDRHLQGSARWQEYLGTSDHRNRWNHESIEALRMRLASTFCEVGQFEDALEVTSQRALQSATELLRLRVRGSAFFHLRRYREGSDVLNEALSLPTASEDAPEIQVEVRLIQMNLAAVLLELGEIGAAERAIRAAERNFRQVLSDGHPDLVECRLLLARILFDKGTASSAWTIAESTLDEELEFLTRTAGGLRESELLKVLRRMRRHSHDYFNRIGDRAQADPHRVGRGMAYLARRKGLSLAASAKANRVAMMQGQRGKRLREVRGLLSEALFGGRGRDRAWIEKLENERVLLEKNVAMDVDADVPERPDDLRIEDLGRHLREGEAYVDFVQVRSNQERGRSAVSRYLAFALARVGDGPILVDLGPAEKIDTLVRRFYTACRDVERGDEWRQISARLQAALFRPLTGILSRCKHLLLSPDGDLNYLPLAAIIDDDGRPFLERFKISIIDSGSALMSRAPATRMNGNVGECVLLGDPDFDASGPRPRKSDAARGLGSHPLLSDSLAQDRPRFARLPATRREVSRIAALLRRAGRREVLEVVGRAASKAALSSVRSPQLLHIATHAFHLPPLPWESDEESAFVSNVAAGAVSGLAPLANLSTSEYLRSGLVLSGANQDGRRADASLMCAEEVLSLDLRQTSLVVLSACETALGFCNSLEGVQGLHRAFLIAGARNVVGSLWKVDDEATMTLMVHFYEHYLGEADPAGAIQRAMLTTSSVARLSHPSFWAGFLSFGAP